MIEPTTMQLRNTLRQTFRERRKRLSLAEQAQAAEMLVAQVSELGLLHSGMKVALYMTNDGELNTQNLIEYCWQHNIQVYLPVLHPFCDGHLLFIQYTDDSPMRANGFGIAEPKLDCRKVCPADQLDVMFSPLVAFDNQGNRLGMGGGFYDRTLQQFDNAEAQAPTIIGLAHDIQQTLTLPTEAWDIPLPNILTPTAFHQYRK